MSDDIAVKAATKIREEFWEDFDQALSPKYASKRIYAEQLEELVTEAEGRLVAVNEEIIAEGE